MAVSAQASPQIKRSQKKKIATHQHIGQHLPLRGELGRMNFGATTDLRPRLGRHALLPAKLRLKGGDL